MNNTNYVIRLALNNFSHSVFKQAIKTGYVLTFYSNGELEKVQTSGENKLSIDKAEFTLPKQTEIVWDEKQMIKSLFVSLHKMKTPIGKLEVTDLYYSFSEKGTLLKNGAIGATITKDTKILKKNGRFLVKAGSSVCFLGNGLPLYLQLKKYKKVKISLKRKYLVKKVWWNYDGKVEKLVLADESRMPHKMELRQMDKNRLKDFVADINWDNDFDDGWYISYASINGVMTDYFDREK